MQGGQGTLLTITAHLQTIVSKLHFTNTRGHCRHIWRPIVTLNNDVIIKRKCRDGGAPCLCQSLLQNNFPIGICFFLGLVLYVPKVNDFSGRGASTLCSCIKSALHVEGHWFNPQCVNCISIQYWRCNERLIFERNHNRVYACKLCFESLL